MRGTRPHWRVFLGQGERGFFSDNLLFRIHSIIVDRPRAMAVCILFQVALHPPSYGQGDVEGAIEGYSAALALGGECDLFNAVLLYTLHPQS